VLSLEGPVEISTDGGRNFSSLRLDRHPGKADWIRTSSSSRAALALLPNALIQLEPGTTIEIVRLALTKDGNETGPSMRGRFAEFKLLNGRIFVSHNWGDTTARFVAATRDGEVIATSNALFCIHSNETSTRVTCASGTIGFHPAKGGAVASIAPGFMGEWSGNAATVTAADLDTRGQKDAEEALPIEQTMRALSVRLSKSPPGLQEHR